MQYPTSKPDEMPTAPSRTASSLAASNLNLLKFGDDIRTRFDGCDVLDASPSLPNLAVGVECSLFVHIERPRQHQRARQCLCEGVAQQKGHQRVHIEPTRLHLRRADHARVGARELVCPHDVVRFGRDDRLLVRRGDVALVRRDEARPQLRASVSSIERPAQPGRIANSASTHQRNICEPPRAQLLREPLCRAVARLPTHRVVEAVEAAHAGVARLARDFRRVHVVVHLDAVAFRPLDDRVRLTEARQEELDPLIDRDVHPLFHLPHVFFVRHDGEVHTERPARQPFDQTEPFAEVVAVQLRKRDGLHHSKAARFAHGSYELWVRARVHWPFDDGNSRAGVLEQLARRRRRSDRHPAAL
mmetsp:Transcript_48975/g.113221  ORF Transcript_48975/g.113221 Transcript_48975/m.113221 type:complete len:359 (+) Transcript_48975:342-1418(+)